MIRRKLMAALPAILLIGTCRSAIPTQRHPQEEWLSRTGCSSRRVLQCLRRPARRRFRRRSIVAPPLPQSLDSRPSPGLVRRTRHDHVWIYNRARTLTKEEAGLEGAHARRER